MAIPDTKNLYSKIIQALKDNANKEIAKIDKFYHKKEGYKSYGLRIPTVKEIIKQFKPAFERLAFAERMSLAQRLYKSGFAEEGRIANFLLSLSIHELTPKDFGKIDKMANCFNNWDEVDDFSLNVAQPLLQKYPKETLRLLRKWNKSKNVWKRRASVVAFVRKIGESGRFTDDALKLCDNLIWDEEDLVRKAVGWALKDVMKGDKEKVLNYVKRLRRKGVSSTIILYAIRDLKNRERERVLKIESIRTK